MYASTLEDLYEAVEKPGGLTARLRLEVLVGDLQAVTAAPVVPASEGTPTIPSPISRTVPSSRGRS